jgi:hypothetical protein
MKVLFLGDYSGLHWTLAQGLRSLGHEAFVSASGDGFKSMRYDKRLCIEGGGPRRSLLRKFQTLLDLPQYSGYDVVQLINPFVFGKKGYNRWYVDQLKKRNGKLVLTAAGDDPVVAARILSGGMRYSFMHAAMAAPFGSREFRDITRLVHHRYVEENLRILDRMDAVMPFSYEYQVGYRHSVKCTPIVPYPFDPSLVSPTGEQSEQTTLNVFHGLSRSVFKGSGIISEGMQMARCRHGDALKITIADRMPYDDYVRALGSADILIDQCNSYGYAMNAIIGLAMKKIVFSGAEPEALRALGIPMEECPVVNIIPDPEQVAESISSFVLNFRKTQALKAVGAAYAEKHHSLAKVSAIYAGLCEKL